MALRSVSRTHACCSRLYLPLFISRHLFSSSSAFCRRPLSLTCLGIPKSAARFTLLQCQVSWFSDSADSPLNSDGGGSRDSNFPWPPAKMDPVFHGCDFNHWLIVMDKPGGEAATKEQMIDCYIKTLAKVLGSEEAAKKKIYNVSCVRHFGFGCEIDEETANKLEGLPGVLMVLADSYLNAENKDYGTELFVNGEIVQRSPVPEGAHDKAETGDTEGELKVKGSSS